MFKGKLLLASILFSSAAAFADITSNLSAQPFAINGKHGNKIYVMSEHFASVINNSSVPAIFTITYKVCAEDECYSLASNNRILSAYESWSDHEKIMTSKKFNHKGDYQSSAMTLVTSGTYQNKAESHATIHVS